MVVFKIFGNSQICFPVIFNCTCNHFFIPDLANRLNKFFLVKHIKCIFRNICFCIFIWKRSRSIYYIQCWLYLLDLIKCSFGYFPAMRRFFHLCHYLTKQRGNIPISIFRRNISYMLSKFFRYTVYWCFCILDRKFIQYLQKTTFIVRIAKNSIILSSKRSFPFFRNSSYIF